MAVLAGDALIVMAFDALASESESKVSLSQYQRAKTGALFVAATCAGALSAGADPREWHALGERLGEAYQIADDIRDVMGQADLLGKPVGQDAQHARPNAIANLGLGGAAVVTLYGQV